MTAKQFMNPNPVIIRASDTIAHGAKQIMAKQRRDLPVVDDEGRFQGMLTANCLLYLVLPKAATMERGLDALPFVQNSLDDLRERLKKYLDKPITLCLKKKDVAVVHPDTPMLETLLILYHAKSNLPVVEKNTGKLVGTISYYNVGAKIMEEGFD
ncbi:MAG: CBS domain-containing protein [Gammaproteobacteria bacterium]|nr:CBS domain-containing protein [Gammaproteobacteria bacterium]